MKRLTLIVLGVALAGTAMATGKGDGVRDRQRGDGMGQEKPIDQQGKITQELQGTVANLHQYYQHMIALGRIAQQQGTSKDVRDLGNDIVTEYTKLVDELGQWATNNQVTLNLAQKPPRFDQQVSELQGLTGKSFDRSFTQLVSEESRLVNDELEAALVGLEMNTLKGQFQDAQKAINRYLDVDTRFGGQPDQLPLPGTN